MSPLILSHTHCVALLPLLTAVRGQLLVVLLALLLQPHVLPHALSKGRAGVAVGGDWLRPGQVTGKQLVVRLLTVGSSGSDLALTPLG